MEVLQHNSCTLGGEYESSQITNNSDTPGATVCADVFSHLDNLIFTDIYC